MSLDERPKPQAGSTAPCVRWAVPNTETGAQAPRVPTWCFFDCNNSKFGWRCYVLRVPSMLSDATLQRLLQLPEIQLKSTDLLIEFFYWLFALIYTDKCKSLSNSVIIHRRTNFVSIYRQNYRETI